MKEISIVVPVLNEETAIPSVLKSIKKTMDDSGFSYEIIVVDDGSTDRSVEMAQNSGVSIQLIKHSTNRGYGAALVSGIKKAKYDWIAITDGDGSYPIEVIPEMLRYTNEYDMVVGARTLNPQQPLSRGLAKWFLVKLANYLSGERIPDLNSGLRLIRKEAVEKFLRILPNGFSFTTTITLALLTNHYRVKYIPISYHKRIGRSKFRPFEDTLNFIQLIIRTVMYFSPLRIFLPLSGFILLSLLVSLTYDIFRGNIMDKTVILFVAFVIVLSIGCLADLIDKRL